jgi:hypothetical protein
MANRYPCAPPIEIHFAEWSSDSGIEEDQKESYLIPPSELRPKDFQSDSIDADFDPDNYIPRFRDSFSVGSVLSLGAEYSEPESSERAETPPGSASDSLDFDTISDTDQASLTDPLASVIEVRHPAPDEEEEDGIVIECQDIGVIPPPVVPPRATDFFRRRILRQMSSSSSSSSGDDDHWIDDDLPGVLDHAVLPVRDRLIEKPEPVRRGVSPMELSETTMAATVSLIDEGESTIDATVYRVDRRPTIDTTVSPIFVRQSTMVETVCPIEEIRFPETNRVDRLFEYVCERSQPGSLNTISLSLIVEKMHNITIPPNVARFSAQISLADCRCNAVDVPMVCKSNKKGIMEGRENKLLLHFEVRPEVVVRIDFLGDGRILGSTNLSLFNPHPISHGQHLLLLSQKPEKNSFLKRVQKNPCLEVQVQSIDSHQSARLQRLPSNIILPVAAVEPTVAFRNVLRHFRSGSQDRSRVQVLSLFGLLLGKPALMKKLDQAMADALKKIPKERKPIEKHRLFLKLLGDVALTGLVNPPPFETPEVSGLYTAYDWTGEPLDIAHALLW